MGLFKRVIPSFPAENQTNSKVAFRAMLDFASARQTATVHVAGPTVLSSLFSLLSSLFSLLSSLFSLLSSLFSLLSSLSLSLLSLSLSSLFSLLSSLFSLLSSLFSLLSSLFSLLSSLFSLLSSLFSFCSLSLSRLFDPPPRNTQKAQWKSDLVASWPSWNLQNQDSIPEPDLGVVHPFLKPCGRLLKGISKKGGNFDNPRTKQRRLSGTQEPFVFGVPLFGFM